MFKLDDIEEAYRKLKSYFYYDNFNFSVRSSIASFESEGNIEKKFTNLLSIIHSKAPTKSKVFLELLSRIKVLTIPKSYETIHSRKKDEFILTNKSPILPYRLSRLNYLVDAPIEIHILSVLWIINEGYCLQKSFERYNYAYKIVIDKNKDKVVGGLRLFEKYFDQYQKWRDYSIGSAKSLLENSQDATIVQMDIKEYFHNVPLDFDRLKKEISEIKKGNLVFTEMLEAIYRSYFSKLQESSFEPQFDNNFCSLPIGLLSSGVLGNWYLQEFDKKVVDKLGPTFYGRYVDDIIIVLANSPIKREPKQSALEKFIDEQFVNRELLITKTNNDDTNYFLNLSHNNYQVESLLIQKNKFSILEFSHTESIAALNNFILKLRENSSIFWMLPEEEKDSKDFDKNANDLIYSDSTNKLRSLNEILPSKFGASIFLAKRILSSLLSDEKASKNTDAQLLTFFKGKYCLEFYQLWEKVATYFVVNDKKNEFWDFYKICCEAISNIESKNSIEYKTTKEIKVYLLDYLKTSIALAIGLNPKFVFEKGTSILKKMKAFKFGVSIKELSSLVMDFRKSNLIRHNLVTIPLLNYTSYSQELNSPYLKPLLIKNEIKFIESLNEKNLKLDLKAYKYSPRYVHLFETNLHSFYEFIVVSTRNYLKGENYDFNQQLSDAVLNKSFSKFYNLNYGFRNDLDKDFEEKYKKKLYELRTANNYTEIEINSPKHRININKVSVAVANHKISSTDIEPSIKNNLKFTNFKKQNLIRILNQSEEEKSDMLILPEISLPFKWLIRLSDESRRKQRAIIGGIEHFSINRVCYNYMVTILPITLNGINESIIVPRLKNHYSPEEKLLIKNIRYKTPPQNNFFYHLYKWNGISFTAYNCYELADVEHRALFKSKVDIIFASEYNKDWKYFSNVAESITRDIHCYYVQSNTSNIGDSRIIQPTESKYKDILRLKGGQKSSVLVGILDIKKLRDFQEKEYIGQRDLKTFKPTPPQFDKENVNKR